MATSRLPPDRPKVRIVQPAENPVPADILATSIVELAKAAKSLLGTRLKRDTLILLLHDTTGVGKRDIAYVLNALDNIEHNFIRPRA